MNQLPVSASEEVVECPKVSVLCPTYQHVSSIERCVRSLVSQVTSFPYEVIVRDDASTDGTQEILLLLEQEFPEKVRLILERSNSFDEESPLVPLFAAAKGEYFALCEGDDYWTSNHKLQLCVYVLEAKPEVVLVGHLSTIGPLYTPGSIPMRRRESLASPACIPRAR